mmetsp:Transcript_27714/g.110974  ORF Transcript_27714/g.110974 Transcript_27714/m.110974 type:complete len:208 (+) Transcript_27714:728-1351(+)
MRSSRRTAQSRPRSAARSTRRRSSKTQPPPGRRTPKRRRTTLPTRASVCMPRSLRGCSASSSAACCTSGWIFGTSIAPRWCAARSHLHILSVVSLFHIMVYVRGWHIITECHTHCGVAEVDPGRCRRCHAVPTRAFFSRGTTTTPEISELAPRTKKVGEVTTGATRRASKRGGRLDSTRLDSTHATQRVRPSPGAAAACPRRSRRRS